MSETIPAPPKKPIPPTPPIPPTLPTKPVPPQKNKGQKIKNKTGTAAVVSPSVLKGHSSVNASNRETTLFYPSLYGGRFTRAQYWCYYITGLFLSPIFSIVFFWAESLHFVPFSIFYGLPITVKRIHDLGYSAILPISIIFGVGALDLWALHNEMLIIGFIAAIILFGFTIWIGFFDSQEGANSYGDSIKYPDLLVRMRKAISTDDSEQILRLIKSGGVNHINKLDKERRCLLHTAAKNAQTRIVKLLISAGADVNKADEYGITPLYWASYKGHTEIVKLLIEKGADVNKLNPLLIASENGHTEIVELLKQAGAKE